MPSNAVGKDIEDIGGQVLMDERALYVPVLAQLLNEHQDIYRLDRHIFLLGVPGCQDDLAAHILR